MRAKNLCLPLVISFPYFIARLLTPRCASRGQIHSSGQNRLTLQGNYQVVQKRKSRLRTRQALVPFHYRERVKELYDTIGGGKEHTCASDGEHCTEPDQEHVAMTDTQNTPASQLDRADRSEEEQLAAHIADLRHRIEQAR